MLFSIVDRLSGVFVAFVLGSFCRFLLLLDVVLHLLDSEIDGLLEITLEFDNL